MRVAARGRQAVVLSGGAAYAAYEVGVMKAIFSGESAGTGYEPAEAEVFTGTSAGSFNAAAMVSRPDVDCYTAALYLERQWLELLAQDATGCRTGSVRYRANPVRLLNPVCCDDGDCFRPLSEFASDLSFLAQDGLRRFARFATSRNRISQRVIELFDAGSFISIDPYREYLRANLDLRSIRESPRTLRIAATNWATGDLRVFTNEDMTDAQGVDVVVASSAFPGVPPVDVGGEPFADGGIQLNTPLSPAIDAGADTLHVIYLDPSVRNIPLQRLSSTLDTLNKVYTIAKAAILNRDVETAVDVNRTLELLDPPGAAERASLADLKAFSRVAARIADRIREERPYRKMNIHRYHPRDELGGALGLLQFGREQIAALIDRGFRDGAEHDCLHSECFVPDV